MSKRKISTEPKYEIVRFYKTSEDESPFAFLLWDYGVVIKRGLSLENALAYCNAPSTQVEGVYFDTYRPEIREKPRLFGFKFIG